MKEDIKYFVFNKEVDFVRGSIENINISKDGIKIDNINKNVGIFFSRLLDSKEKEMIWHRLVVESEDFGESSIHFSFFVSESPTINYDDKEYLISDIINDKSISNYDKENIFSQHLVKSLYSPKDAILHEIKGRYLWFRVRLMVQGECNPAIHKIKIYFPKRTWLEYLPEIYYYDSESTSFVERFLGICQSLYEDMTNNIEYATSYFDANIVQGDYLRWLATWLNIEDNYIWNDNQLKYIINNAIRLYKKRGTISYLIELIELYIGNIPYIVEYYDIIKFCNNKEKELFLKRLYGDSPYIFNIIIKPNNRISKKDYKVLKKIIDNSKPAYMESNIVILEPYIFLDKYSYLGINSILGKYKTTVLDGSASIPFIKIKDIQDTEI